jgi:hypothetical protein
MGSSLQSWCENRSRKEKAKRKVVQSLRDTGVKSYWVVKAQVQIQHVDQERLISNNNDVEEFRIGSKGGAGCSLLGESEALRKKTAKV